MSKVLADAMYPNVTMTIEDLEIKFPKRNLDEGAIVTRYAPSPTGFIHLGNLMTTFVANKVAKDSKGVYYLRIEDTDLDRTVENGVEGIINDLNSFEIGFDEGATSITEGVGEYGPYIQTKRKEIYDVCAKYLVENDYAYPCFCKSEEIDAIRAHQESRKERLGYYGRHARCRYLSEEERISRINNGESYVLRLKSDGDFNKKVTLNDLVRGRVDFPQNDIDHVLIKSNGIPVYHMAHVVDDHFMRTTHVLRGEEWISSTPLHIELFNKLNFEIPKFCHLGLLMKDDNGTRRKLSKRKDPEAAVSYYAEVGIPVDAVKLYLLTLANSNFEGWMDQNKDKSIDDFAFDFKKMSVNGSLFDVEKLNNISKNYMSRMSASEVFEGLNKWSSTYDKEFNELINNYKDYTINILNIEREIKKPRKDFGAYNMIKDTIWYMYDELFNAADKSNDWQKINDVDEISNIYNTYLNKYYDESDDKETWFNKIKSLCEELGYTTDMKAYKENPDNFKGSVADVSQVIRIAATTKSTTPDLYEVLKLLGKEKLIKRSNHF